MSLRPHSEATGSVAASISQDKKEEMSSQVETHGNEPQFLLILLSNHLFVFYNYKYLNGI